MKLDISIQDLKNQTAMETVVSIEKEQKLLYRERKIKGLTFWQKNLHTGEITKAPLEPVFHNGKTVLIHGFVKLKTDSGFSYQIKKQDGFEYCQALNKANAIKKFNKLNNK